VDIRPASREKVRAYGGDNDVELEAAAETVIFGAPRGLGHGMESKILFFHNDVQLVESIHTFFSQ
jgi:hypothetical protein